MEGLIIIILVGLVLSLIIAPMVILAKLSDLQTELQKLSQRFADQFDKPAANFSRPQTNYISDGTSKWTEPEETPPPIQTPPELPIQEPSDLTPEITPKPPELSPELTPHPVATTAWSSPTPAPLPHAEPSAFETAAREVLGKIWQWLVVGEDHRPQGVTLEFAVATTWLLRLGILILIIGIGFFLKYTTTNGEIPAQVRIIISVVTGFGLVGFGLWLFRTRYRLLGEGLAGAGFSTFYFAFYSAQKLDVCSPTTAFIVMILTTLSIGFIAIRANSLLLALLGLIGGYLTPLMIQNDSSSLPVLFTY